MAVEPTEQAEVQQENEIDLGNYEIIRGRLLAKAKELGDRALALNQDRQEKFGGTELSIIGNERVRTEFNCIPRDIVPVKGFLLFGYNVFMGLKSEISSSDIFSLHHFEQKEGAFDLSTAPLDSAKGFLTDARFQREFQELREYYKDSKLIQLRIDETKLLAVFQTGQSYKDVKVFRWTFDVNRNLTYLDNRGERDHVFPPSHDFEWKETTADMHVRGQHPHINILDQVFVETVGGDLTIKIEDNTSSGEGLYAEPVEDANQSLDDAPFFYAQVGNLILLKVTPYREEVARHFVFNTRRKEVVRIDAIGQACVQLPEDHGIIFPGGYYLQTGDYKVFDAEVEDLIFKRAIRSPNGEDVLFVFHRREAGSYVLYPYNMVRKEVQTPIQSAGYSIFDDGKMLVFGRVSDEPSRVHPVQVWQTPFVSAEHAAAVPTDDSLLSRIGNADLVRGISDVLTVQRLVEASAPSRESFEDVISTTTRTIDTHYWIGEEEVGDFKGVLEELRSTAELIIDEFEKVQALQKAAHEALEGAREKHRELNRGLSPERWDRIERFLQAMRDLRTQRGHLITLRDVRYIDLEALDEMEAETVERFEKVSALCVKFLLAGQAFDPVRKDLDELLKKVEKAEKASDTKPLVEELGELANGLNLLVEVVSGIEVEDATQRTKILEQISEVLGHLNRVRATVENRRKSLMSAEGKDEFVAQFKLFGQSISSALSLCDTPEKCDEQLSRLMVQLEDLEGRFSEFDEFLGDLATKREEVYEAFGTRKQTLLDERQRRVQNIVKAADRILQGVTRRSQALKTDDELNAYYASDPMIHKLRQLSEQLVELKDTVKADELLAKLKSARQDALRGLRDRQDLFEDGAAIIKLGKHRFSVNTQPLELTMVNREIDGVEGMAVHLTGTDFYEMIQDEAFLATRPFWSRTLVSESKEVYRAEYLAAQILAAAEAGEEGLSLKRLHEITREEGLLGLVREFASDRYEEGYERGLHDADASAILEKLLSMRTSAGLLRFPARPRALAMLTWAFCSDTNLKGRHQRKAASLGRLREAFGHSPKIADFGATLAEFVAAFAAEASLSCSEEEASLAGSYLFEELKEARPRFSISSDAAHLKEHLYNHLEKTGTRRAFDEDLRALEKDLAARLDLLEAWLEALVVAEPRCAGLDPVIPEAAALLAIDRRLDSQTSEALTSAEIKGLMGQHSRISDGVMQLRLDEFVSRLARFQRHDVPGYRDYRARRGGVVDQERDRLRISEFMPRVMSAFVRNRLINEVYLHLIGDNLAKQMGAAGANKRTDLMGLLLLISPPGYGKTTLMEYVASRLGIVFMKVNGPSLGHSVHSLDPSEAPNATARQEVEKVNLAFEMGNNVMLYLDDIQHTHPEFLQKFISLCDATRRIEGVWNGKTKTYDFRGKKFCVVMAGNPYTESGDKFQIPDMLANRADTYNLGDILDGKDDVFALSYIENALTSNSSLAPLATRDYNDVYKLIRMAQGEEIPTTDLSHNYSGVEVSEITSVMKKLFVAQDTLLKVNQTYIHSASMDDEFRTEPRFQLQGSYRNMNKLAEKIVSAMNDKELAALIRDHYVGEAQTLTTGAEHNLLKFGEIQGTLNAEDAARWKQIRSDYRRNKVMGGSGDDPVARVTGTLATLGQRLEDIGASIANAVTDVQSKSRQRHPLEGSLAHIDASLSKLAEPRFEPLIERIEPALNRLAEPRFGPLIERIEPALAQLANAQQSGPLAAVLQKLNTSLMKLAMPKDPAMTKALKGVAEALQQVSRPQLEVKVDAPPPPGVEELLAQQVAIVERTLVPLVRTTTRNLSDGKAIHGRLEELVGLLKKVDAQLRDGGWAGALEAFEEEPLGGSDTQKMTAVPKREDW